MLRRRRERRDFIQIPRRQQVRKKRGKADRLPVDNGCIENLCEMFVCSARLSGKAQHSQERNRALAPTSAGEPQGALITHKSLLKMLIYNLQPLEMTGDFLDFVKTLHPALMPPPAPVIHSQLRQLYNTTKEELRVYLSSARHVALTCELWSARDPDRYLTVGCHFVDSCDKLRSCVLQTSGYFPQNNQDHNGEELTAIVDAWDIKDKVCAVVTAGMEDKSYRAVNSKCVRVGCFAEALQEAWESSMYNVQVTLKKCVDITRFFKTDSEAMGRLREIQSLLGMEKLELVLSRETEWFLVLPMLQSLSRQHQSMLMVLDERDKTDLILSSDDKDNIQNIIAALQPLDEAVSTMKKEGFQTIAFVLLMMKRVIGKLKEEEKRNNEVAKLLLIYVQCIFDYKEEFLCPTFLDPRLKNLLQGSDRIKARDEVIKALGGNTYSPEDKYKVLVDRYEAYNPPEQITNSLTWWRHTGEQFPELRELALKKLITASTAVPFKRAFSGARQRFNALRSSIEPEDLDMMLFLNSNGLALL